MRKFWLSTLGLIVVWGFYWGIYSLINGHELLGVNNNTPWGLLLSGYTFIVSTSIGCCFVGSLWTVFGIEKYKSISKKAIFMAIIIVMVGMSVIFVELGKPFRMFLSYLTSPNPTSPILWMGVNYTLYLFFITLEFIFLLKEKYKLVRITGLLAFLIALSAETTVSSVFGVEIARPFWYGPFMPIDFVLCAWILGFALISIVIYSSNSKMEERNYLMESSRKWLATLLAINMFFIFSKIITGIYVDESAKYLPTLALLSGPLSLRFWLFEILIGTLIPFIFLITSKQISITLVASILSIIGMFANKINMVEAGQIVPAKAIDYEVFIKYSPTIPEIAIILGAISFLIIAYKLAERFYFERDIKA